MNVLLWGLPGSGRTAMILALIRGLAKYGSDLGWEYALNPSLDDKSRFYYQEVISPFIEHDLMPAKSLSFTSVCLDLKCKGSKTDRIYNHSISIYDFPSKFDHGQLEDTPLINESNSPHGVIILLDQQSTTHSSHMASLPLLQNYLATFERMTNFYVAICLSKSDIHYRYAQVKAASNMLQEKQRKEFIKEIIGHEVVHSIEKLFNPNRTRFFLSSSVGWVGSKHGDFFPNLTSIIGQESSVIYRPEKWHPWHILEPFFWLLDVLELFQKDRFLKDIRYEQHLADYWEWRAIINSIPDYKHSFFEWQRMFKRK